MPELIIFVGLQGSGKSTYYREHFAATHVHVSKDLMPNTRDKDARQQREIAQAIAAGKSVVVDNTNPTPEVRAPLIALGSTLGAKVIAIWMDTPVRTVLARNAAREGRARVPNPAIFATLKKLKPPEASEGFDEVRVVTTPS